MSRSGYGYDVSTWDQIRWNGALKSAIRGKRGQAFFREMLAALDALPVKELEEGLFLRETGECCAMGAVARSRFSGDPEQIKEIVEADDDWYPLDGNDAADILDIPRTLACHIAYENDEGGPWNDGRAETSAERFARMRAWVVGQIAGGKDPCDQLQA